MNISFIVTWTSNGLSDQVGERNRAHTTCDAETGAVEMERFATVFSGKKSLAVGLQRMSSR